MTTKSLQHRFPNLFQLLGYLGQDFDVYGPNLGDAVNAFVADSTMDELLATRKEIADFLISQAENLEEELERLGGLYSCEPDMSAHDYLLWLDQLVTEGIRRREGGSAN